MKRTSPTPVIALFVIGLAVGFLAEISAAASGVPVFVAPLSLPITLVVIAAGVVILAWPIRKATKGDSGPVNPFVAMRIAVLAKSASLSGSLLFGAGTGILLYLLTRAVMAPSDSLWLTVAGALGGAVLLIAGLVAEFFCTLPPDDHEHEPGGEHV
jgi:uncharacterized membrane protein YczE